MTRLRACLDGLPTLERRVLVLRAGLGPGRPRARARVARVLDLSAARVRRLERRGLRRLRGLARGGCGGGRDLGWRRRRTEPSGESSTTTVFAVAPLADRVEVKGEQDSSRDRGDGPEPKRAPPAAAQPKLPAAILGDKSGADVTVPLLALAAAARDRLRRPQRDPLPPQLSALDCPFDLAPVRGFLSPGAPRRPTSERLMARGDVRIAVTLACEECKRRNYQTNKSKRNNPDRISLQKYCRWCRRHTGHRETR